MTFTMIMRKKINKNNTFTHSTYLPTEYSLTVIPFSEASSIRAKAESTCIYMDTKTHNIVSVSSILQRHAYFVDIRCVCLPGHCTPLFLLLQSHTMISPPPETPPFCSQPSHQHRNDSIIFTQMLMFIQLSVQQCEFIIYQQ